MPVANHTAAVDDDSTAAARALQGDDAAFELLVRRYRNEVYALCYYFTRNREDAWDLSQETFIKAYRALASFRGEAGFKTWLMRIAANHCKDHLKRRRVSTTSYDDALQASEVEAGQTPAEAAQARELGAIVDAAVRSLPPKHQAAFILREYEGLSYQEMASVLGCGIGTVMSRLFNARRRLQQALAPLGLMEMKESCSETDD